MRRFILIGFFLLSGLCLLGSEEHALRLPVAFETPMNAFWPAQQSESDLYLNHRPHPIFTKFNKRAQKNKKYLAAALAFPFPFGIVGMHRIYLGCEPYIPVAYIATVGGGFGVLPFIDFCAILAHKDADTFVNNKKVFMWIK